MRAVRILPAVALAACFAVGAACSSQISGTGTGAGPRSGAAVSSTAASASSSATSVASASASASTSSSAAGSHPVPSQPMRAVTAHASDGTTYLVKIWAEKVFRDCAAHAYGAPVINFLRSHPCAGMRSLLATTTVDGRAVGFAERAIGFRGSMNRSYRSAGSFRALVSRSGTGNLDDLMREGYRLPAGPSAVPFPNAFSALGQDNGVTVVEAWYLHGPTPDNDPALVKMAEDIFLQV